MKVLAAIIFGLFFFSACAENLENSFSEFLQGLQKVSRAGRVVGGQVVPPNSIPYQALVLSSFRGISTNLCGGSIINRNTVLTAAQCLEQSLGAQVTVGAHQITNVEPTQQTFPVPLSNHRVHPNYDPSTLENNIAILHLQGNGAIFNEFVQPVVLPAFGDDRLFIGEVTTVSGWGITSSENREISPLLRSVDNTVISNEVCRVTFGGIINTKILCTSTIGGGSCLGDNGGPLTINIGGNRVQIGIVSFHANAGCAFEFPVGFTRITSYLQWIADNSSL